MRVLVTGATGFVGSHCLDALSTARNITPIAACRNPANLPEDYTGEIRTGDLRNAQDITAMLQDIDAIIHAAAWSSLWNNRKKSETLYLQPSLELIKIARQSDVNRFIFVSSLSVAAPDNSADAMNPGTIRRFWPHEANVVRIENELRRCADNHFNVVNLRFGLFAGARYGLGLLPILAPRLKTHLVPWVAGGHTSMPIIDGRDIGQAATLAAGAKGLKNYESINVVGPETPSVREVLTHLHDRHDLPLPYFSVPFAGAFAFGWLMEKLDVVVPWEPLVTRSVIHLLQETHGDNRKAAELLGYIPRHHWRQAIDLQMREMAERQIIPMKMAKSV